MVELEVPEKKLHTYFFPDILGKAMMGVPLNVQLEANLVSMSLMSVGLIITIIYLCVYFNLALWYKIFLIINGIAGLMFFISSIVTTFQQYNNYMEILEYQNRRY